MAFVFLDDVGSVFVGVERVHEDKGYVDVVGAVEVLDLTDGKIKEGHAVTDFDDGFGSDAAHGGTKTTVELDNSEFVQELDRIRVWKNVVLNDLICMRRLDAVPREDVALGLVVEVAAEKRKEVVHLGFEPLLLFGVFDGIAEVV